MDQKTIAINMMVTGPFPAQIAAAGAQVQTFGNQANAGMAKAQTGMARFGAAAMKVATFGLLAVGAGLALSAKAAIDFESSFAGIRKTVDTSEAGFRMLAQGIRQMATEIPIGVNELNRIGELGGQLGVKPGDLLEFIDVIAKIGVTTTLSTDQAAMGFARIDNIMQLGGKSFDNMGASIVDLGNNFAATEDEILTFALRVAPVGATVGLVTDEVLGIATAFTSVGIPAERGGTAIQKTLISMAEAAKNGGVELDVFAETAGMTAEAFAAMFESDPAEAFTLFVEGLGRVNEEGGNTFAVLDAVGLGNERVRASLLAAANAGDVLRESLALSATAWGDNTALTEEAQKRFETTASALIILKNKVQDLAITLGSSLLPAINTFIDGGVYIADFFAALDGGMQAAILAVPAFLAAMAVAAAHPAVAAIIAATAGVYAIGAISKNSAAGTASIEASVRKLNDEFDRNSLEEYLTAQGIDVSIVRRDMEAAGHTMEYFADAVSGSDEQWNAFYNNVMKKQPVFKFKGWDPRRWFDDSTQDVMQRARKAYLDAQVNVASQLAESIYEVDEAEAELWRRQQDRARQGASGVGGVTGREPPQITAGLRNLIDLEYMGDIDTMFDDYVAVFTEAFDATDERIRGQIDLWYEFGDALDIPWDELLPNLLRQVNAVGAFESILDELNLSQQVKDFLRASFPDGAGKEAFVNFFEGSEGAARIWVAEIASIMENDLMRVIFNAYTADFPNIDFTAGDGLLTAMEGIVAKIENDTEGRYSAGEVWLGLIEAALIRGGPGLAPQIMATLEEVFGVGGIPGVDATIEDIRAVYDELVALGLLPKLVEFEVNTRFTTTGEPWTGMQDPADSNRDDIWDFPRNAFGGSVRKNEPTWVGEYGPEIFRPYSNGTIIPNYKLDGLGGTTRHTTVNVIRPETNDLAGDISEGLTRASISEQVDLIGAY